MKGFEVEWEERMLSSLVKEHQGRQVARKEQQEVNKLLTVLLFVIFRDENNLDQL